MASRRQFLTPALSLALLWILVACGPEPIAVQGQAFGFAEIASFDTAVGDGAIHLLMAGRLPGAETTTIRYSYSTDGGSTWAPAVRVDAGAPPPDGLHLGNDVQLAVSAKRRVAVWPTAGTGYMGSGPLATAISTDGGAHWRPGPNPADDGSTDGHGFAGMVADAKGRIHIVWLDNRSGHQALYHTVSVDGGAHWRANVSIDNATCQCCANTLAPRPDGGVAVLYRNMDPRDMALAISSPESDGWRQRGVVGDFNWHIDACPHAGGDLAFTERGLHAVVYTGKPEVAGLYYLFSADGGAHWQAPLPLAGAEAGSFSFAGRGQGNLAVVWTTPGETGRTLAAATSRDGGRHWHKHRLAVHIRHGTRPRLLPTTDGWRLAWIRPAEQGGGLALASLAR